MVVYHEFKNGKEVKKKHLALTGVIFGLCTYPFLPLGFKFFIFIIPVILLAIIWSSKYDSFNIHIFFICLSFSFLLPSNAFIFDARKVYGLNGGSSDNSFNLFFTGLYHFIDIACVIIMAIPVFLIVVTIYSAITGNASKATTGFARVLLTIGFTILVFFIFDFAGIDLGGMTGTILEFYTDLINFMLKLPLYIYDLVKMISFGVLPDLPSGYNSDITFDMTDGSYSSTKATFNSLNYAQTILTISDLLPIFAMVASFLTFLLFCNDERAERLEIWLTKLSADYLCPKCGSVDIEILGPISPNKEILLLCENDQCEYYLEKKKKERYKADPAYFRKQKAARGFYPNVDFSILLVFGIILSGSFLIFLSYSNYFQNSFDSSLMWRYIGFFGVYLSMITIPLLVMLSGKVYYKRSNLNETVKGTLYGYFGLWLLTRLFFTRKVMSCYSAQGLDVSLGITYLLEQSLYVGPAETIFFVIFGLSAVATYLRSYTKENIERGYEEDRNTQLQIKESEKVVYSHIENAHETDLTILDNDLKQLNTSLKTETRPLKIRSIRGRIRKFEILREKTIEDLQKTQSHNRDAEEKIQTLKNERDVAIISDNSIFGRSGSAAILILGVIILAFAAASAHSIVNLNRVDYMLFWTSGFGVYYFSGFVWFGFIYLIWGWKPAIIVHILFNISDILLFFAFMGV